MPVELFRNESLENYQGPLPIDEKWSHRHRVAYINSEAVPMINKLSELHKTGADRFEVTMNLFRNTKFDCILIGTRSTNSYNVFTGVVRNDKGEDTESRVIMTVRNSMLAIDIWVNDKEYQIAALGDDLYIIDEVNLDTSPECNTHEVTETGKEEEEEEEEPSEEHPINVTIGILVIYESNVISQASNNGNEEVLLSHIDIMIENLNAALSASLAGTGTTVVVELLGPIKHDFSEMNNNNCDATDVLMNSKLVKQWRTDYSADLVSVIRTGVNLGTSCADTLTNIKGNANAAYSAVNYTQARQQHSFAHEIGHNFGCPHNKENADANGVNADDNGIFWGYKWQHKNGKKYRTLMAYGDGTRILHFSNPNVLYQGEPTGSADAFNASAIAKTARAISKYR